MTTTTDISSIVFTPDSPVLSNGVIHLRNSSDPANYAELRVKLSGATLTLEVANTGTPTAPITTLNFGEGNAANDLMGINFQFGGVTVAGVVPGGHIQPLSTPASSTAPGLTGQLVYDSGYVYVCTAPNTWMRAALSNF